jgi:hypothetical protein
MVAVVVVVVVLVECGGEWGAVWAIEWSLFHLPVAVCKRLKGVWSLAFPWAAISSSRSPITNRTEKTTGEESSKIEEDENIATCMQASRQAGQGANRTGQRQNRKAESSNCTMLQGNYSASKEEDRWESGEWATGSKQTTQPEINIESAIGGEEEKSEWRGAAADWF